MSSRLSLLFLLSLPGLPACAGVPLPQTALEALVLSEEHLEAGKPGQAGLLLRAIDPESFEGRNLERFKVNLARSYFGLGEYWDCFETLRDFSGNHPSSPFLTMVEELTFRCGERLAASGWTFLGLASDLSDARRILQHFHLSFPNSPRVADALRILGEAAFKGENWDLAIDRFREILEDHWESEWRDLARFRVAMAHFHKLTGPDYDAKALEQARVELAGFLEMKSGNPEFMREAARALSTTRYWIDAKDLRIARFYHRIEKPRGARLYVEKVLGRPDTRFRREADLLLARIQALEARLGAGPEGK